MIGLPPPSARRWTLVENPPRERPRASPPPPDGAGPAGAGGVLVGADDRGVHEMQVPVDLAPRVRLGLQRGQGPVPHPRLAPAVEPARDGADRPVSFGQVAPRRARAQHPQDAVHDPAVVVVRPPGARPLRREQRRQPLPLPIGQVEASHPRQIGPTGRAATPSQTRPNPPAFKIDPRHLILGPHT